MRIHASEAHPERDPRPAGALVHRIRPGGWLTGAVVLALSLSACSSWGNKETGAAIGTAAGAGAGAVVGKQAGSTTRGAIIGAVVGGAAGAIIGNRMDKQAEELKAEVPGAVVERVGEGIQLTFPSGLLFDFDSPTIRASAAGNLRTLAASLATYPDTELLIVGHTDSSGSDAYNQTLSERRADAALEYLVRQGVAPSRMQASGRGEREPMATNETEAGRQANRRIELAIFAPDVATGAPR